MNYKPIPRPASPFWLVVGQGIVHDACPCCRKPLQKKHAENLAIYLNLLDVYEEVEEKLRAD